MGIGSVVALIEIIEGSIENAIIAKRKITPATPPVLPGDVPPPIPPVEPDANVINLNDDSNVFTTIGTRINNALNPFKWFSTQDQVNIQYSYFMDKQLDPHYADLKLYPYTAENPFAPWYKKLSTAVLGETVADEAQRLRLRTFAFGSLDHIKIRVDSPSVASVGLGTHFPFSQDNPWGNTHKIIHNNLERLINSMPNTPSQSPKLPALKLPPLDLPDVAQWKDHTIKPLSVNEIATSSKVTTPPLWGTGEILDEITKESIIPVYGISGSDNKYNALKVVNNKI